MDRANCDSGGAVQPAEDRILRPAQRGGQGGDIGLGGWEGLQPAGMELLRDLTADGGDCRGRDVLSVLRGRPLPVAGARFIVLRRAGAPGRERGDPLGPVAEDVKDGGHRDGEHVGVTGERPGPGGELAVGEESQFPPFLTAAGVDAPVGVLFPRVAACLPVLLCPLLAPLDECVAFSITSETRTVQGGTHGGAVRLLVLAVGVFALVDFSSQVAGANDVAGVRAEAVAAAGAIDAARSWVERSHPGEFCLLRGTPDEWSLFFLLLSGPDLLGGLGDLLRHRRSRRAGAPITRDWHAMYGRPGVGLIRGDVEGFEQVISPEKWRPGDDVGT